MNRKKELKEQYSQMKPDMGIFLIRSKSSNRFHIDWTQDLKSKMNRSIFELKFGSHSNKELQKEWNELGEGNFIIEILDILEYDEDELKIDYSEELILLQMIWEERLLSENMEFYIDIEK